MNSEAASDESARKTRVNNSNTPGSLGVIRHHFRSGYPRSPRIRSVGFFMRSHSRSKETRVRDLGLAYYSIEEPIATDTPWPPLKPTGMKFQTYTTLNDQGKWERTVARARRLPLGGLLCALLYLFNGIAIAGMFVAPTVVVGAIPFNFLPQPFPLMSWQGLVAAAFALVALAFAIGMFFDTMRYWKRNIIAIDSIAFGCGSLLAAAIQALFATGYLQ